jgi:NgoMIV restriction enzyme
VPAPDWFRDRLGWKPASAKTERLCQDLFDMPFGPNLADLGSRSSTMITGEVFRALSVPRERRSELDPEGEGRRRAEGTLLERGIEEDLRSRLPEINPGLDWEVGRSGEATQFSQYVHLRHLQRLVDRDLTLRSAIGRDYQVTTDVMVSVPNRGRTGPPRTLHAAVSSKLTIRSDRVQNVRVEFGTLVRNRRGRAPHLVLVTSEPLPSRLISAARGTGEIDAVYHLLFDEMTEALHRLSPMDKSVADQAGDWREMVDTERLRSYDEMAEIIATG